MDFVRQGFFRLAIPRLRAAAANFLRPKFLLPYFIGAQFGGLVGFALLRMPLTIEDAIVLGITMAILLMIYGVIDLAGSLKRLISNRGASLAQSET